MRQTLPQNTKTHTQSHAFFLLTLLSAFSITLAASAQPIHTVVPVECGQYFTWQSLGIFYSHRKVGQAGKITRVACCTDEDRAQHRDTIHIVPTHVAPSYTVHPRTGDIYSAYNKPLAVLDFLTNNVVEEEYILVIDADMIFVQRFNPVEMGVRNGWAVSAYFDYMRGVNNELALKHVPEVLPRNDTLAGPKGRRGDKCGGFTFMMRDDLARVAPLWLKYTEDVRFDDDAWRLTGDVYATKPGDKPWISEMYGYSYGAAKADVWHIAAREAMTYPQDTLIEGPMVMHYGLQFIIPGTNFSWDKHWFHVFDALKCAPWGLDPSVRSMAGLFNHPPMPSELNSTGLSLMRDLYSILTVNTLNEAFCERHLLKCPPHEEMERECAKVHLISEQVNQGLAELEEKGVGACTDNDPRCAMWGKSGECDNNPDYMAVTCRWACKLCNKASTKHLNIFQKASWEGRYMQEHAEPHKAIEGMQPVHDTAIPEGTMHVTNDGQGGDSRSTHANAALDTAAEAEQDAGGEVDQAAHHVDKPVPNADTAAEASTDDWAQRRYYAKNVQPATPNSTPKMDEGQTEATSFEHVVEMQEVTADLVVRNARKALETQQPAANLLASRCKQMGGLTDVQMHNCLVAASHSIVYEAPCAHVVKPDVDHEYGLLQHAAGGVGFMVSCGVVLIIFVIRPNLSNRRSVQPKPVRRLPL